MSEQRISYITSFTGNFKGLKTEIKTFLTLTHVGYLIQTSFSPENERVTHLLMEGGSAKLFKVKLDLTNHLNIKYPDLQVKEEWKENPSDGPLPQSCILPSKGGVIINFNLDNSRGYFKCFIRLRSKFKTANFTQFESLCCFWLQQYC